MEGHGVYLTPYKRGQCIARKKKNIDKTLKMPRINTDFCNYNNLQTMHILYFKSIFMYTTLPVEGVNVKTRATS